MGTCASKGNNASSNGKATAAAGEIETTLNDVQTGADVVQSVAIQAGATIAGSGADAAAVAGMAGGVSSVAGSIVPWLVGTIDTFVPSLPFGATIASLIKKCYKQACALNDAKGEAAKLSNAVALVAKDLDALNSALAAVKEAVQGGASGDMKKQVRTASCLIIYIYIYI